jgi:hypothetical protein
MQYLMVFSCRTNWRPIGVPVSTAEALQRFKPVRMVVNSCPHCGGMHLYSMNEGHLKVWDEHAMHDAGRVA